MRKTLLWTVLGLGLFGAGWTGARVSVAAEPKKTNYELDAAEMDRTQEVVVGRVRAMNEKLKQIASSVTHENLDDPQKEREKQLGKTLEPVLEDAYVLLIQSFLLAIDNASDKGGEAVENQFLLFCSMKTGVPLKEVAARQEKSGLGIGGVILGYAIAKAGNVPADEIFANKQDNKSWPEVMRARQVTLAQLQAVLDDKNQ